MCILYASHCLTDGVNSSFLPSPRTGMRLHWACTDWQSCQILPNRYFSNSNAHTSHVLRGLLNTDSDPVSLGCGHWLCVPASWSVRLTQPVCGPLGSSAGRRQWSSERGHGASSTRLMGKLSETHIPGPWISKRETQARPSNWCLNKPSRWLDAYKIWGPLM